MATLHLSPLMGHTSRRPRAAGRPIAADDPAERQRRIRAVFLYLSGALLRKQVAAAFGVTGRTIGNWVAVAPNYPDPEAEGLRRLVGRRPA